MRSRNIGRRKPSYQPERDVQKSCIQAAQILFGIKLHRRNTGTFFLKNEQGKERMVKASETGQADTWGIIPGGRHFEIEIKATGNKPSEEQYAWLNSINALGGFATYVDSLPTFIGVMKLLLQGAKVGLNMGPTNETPVYTLPNGERVYVG